MGCVVLADGDDVEVAVMRLCQAVERGQLLHAGRAPGRPEIHQRWLPRKVAETHWVPVRVVERDGGSELAPVRAVDALHLPSFGLRRGCGLIGGGLLFRRTMTGRNSEDGGKHDRKSHAARIELRWRSGKLAKGEQSRKV